MNSTELRVLVHVNHLELGGTQLNAVDLAAALRRCGVRSLIVGCRDTLPLDGPSLLDVVERHGMAVALYDPADHQWARARQVQDIARAFAADLVHVYGSWGGGARAAYWGPARFGRIPWLQTVYEMEVQPAIKRHMPLIVGTDYLLDELRTRPGRTSLIRPPVDLSRDRPGAAGAEEFRRGHGLGDGPLLVIVSRFDGNTKLRPLTAAIEAMRALAGAGATLVIAGDGEEGEALRTVARSVNIAAGRDVVVFTGALLDPAPAYAAADVVIGMGASAARALAFGKPLVVQGFTAWSGLFDETSAEALARASFWSPETVADPEERLAAVITPLLRNRARRIELGEFGRAFAERSFGLEAMAHAQAEIYRETLAAPRRAAWFADLPSEAAILRDKVARRLRHSTSRGVSGLIAESS